MMLHTIDDTLLRGVVAAQTQSALLADRAESRLRRFQESHGAWFVIVIPIVVLVGIAIFAYLTVQCWNRGYNGFTGRFSRSDGWLNATIRFYCE